MILTAHTGTNADLLLHVLGSLCPQGHGRREGVFIEEIVRSSGGDLYLSVLLAPRNGDRLTGAWCAGAIPGLVSHTYHGSVSSLGSSRSRHFEMKYVRV